MTTYRTKSVTVEAVQWTGENVEEIVELFDINPTKLHFGWFVTAPSNISEVPTVSLIDDETFKLNYEPLPESTRQEMAERAAYDALDEYGYSTEPAESTLDLEAIEARCDKLARGSTYASMINREVAALIAEVKRLRRGNN